ncbi:G-type lectin S-receptor-like serine/threonine-protein kinase [Platanthera guangdongensis]|uniref:non-specific serine/threonine protein kinase n=1 Tax=Platanthera guangdongensis TaxID=2320717 RepID=A0ABR2N1N0_9ASPA
MAPLNLLLLLRLFLLRFILPVTGQTQDRSSSTSYFSVSDPPWLPSQSNRSLLSPNSLFSAGFLPSPSNSSEFHLAVWVEASVDKTRVWALGPVSSFSPLFISATGDLTLADLAGANLFPSSASAAPNTTFLRINDDGSLTFSTWTSFASPGNTLLPNQLLRNSSVLSSGFYGFDGSSLLFDNQPFWGVSPFSLITSDGALMAGPTNQGNMLIASDYGRRDTLIRRLTLDADGNLRLYSLWRNSDGRWKIVWVAIPELCVIPNTCGPYSICVPNETYDAIKCICAPGFHTSADGAECVRNKDYLPSSKFLRLDYVQFTAKQGTVNLSPADLDRCRSTCLGNSSCVGFSYAIDGLKNCYNHYGELVDGRWSATWPTTTFLRVASLETDNSSFTGLTAMIDTVCPDHISLPFMPKQVKSTARNVAIIGTIFSFELILGAFCFLAFLRRYTKYVNMARTLGLEFLPAGRLKQFSYSELREATDDFSSILGSGGFGKVYYGNLSDGRAVAVKQLRKSSGDAEFWAEVSIVARMHHLNVVRIWGFCIEKEQRFLVYEYIPNGSLDSVLFQDPEEFAGGAEDEDSKSYSNISKRRVLDLSMRYRIALGVARAIAYLHEECLEWVLHCDIKPENILLDDNFCPKVSDFGLSKLTSKKERVTLSSIRGTRGYMAPEWVMNDEPITAKADVYSFGVVLLELVAGMRNWDFRRDSAESVDWYYPRWAYEKVFVERRIEDVLDARILVSFDDGVNVGTAERMVKTAMWCLQDRPEARPSMGKVTKMLEGLVELTEPAKPTIFYLSEGNVGAKILHHSLGFKSEMHDQHSPCSAGSSLAGR